MHTHVGSDGRHITHSHPFIPSSGHTHSAMQLDQIAGFNASATAMDVAGATAILPSAEFILLSENHSNFDIIAGISLSCSLRAPPSA